MPETSELRVDGVSLSFGGLRALDGISLEVGQGEIVAVIGPNGAGKTSLLNCISGFYQPQKGNIYFEGRPILPLPAHKRVGLGIVRTFQNIVLFSGLTTLDNLLAARHMYMTYGFVEAAAYFGKAQRSEVEQRIVVEEIIAFLKMQDVRKKAVGALPYGLRKRVELGRALALQPKLLLLDEPMAGMSREEKHDMARFILDIHEEKSIPIVLIEHDMEVVMDMANRVVVLDFGRNIAAGPPEKIKQDPQVIEAYLGQG